MNGSGVNRASGVTGCENAPLSQAYEFNLTAEKCPGTTMYWHKILCEVTQCLAHSGNEHPLSGELV